MPQAEKALHGVVMELKDCAFPLLASITATIDQLAGFKACEVAVLVGARPRGPGMERKDLLSANAQIFKAQGMAIEQQAHRNCKVVVVGNPANTNAMICSHFAPSIPKENFTALTRLDQNRAMAQVADKTGAGVEHIKNIVIWGNHSLTQYPDLSGASVNESPALPKVADSKWVQGEFISTVAKRGGAIIAARKLSSAASAASSTCDHVHDWLVGSKKGEIVSMGVLTDGSHYGIPQGICYSLPLTCHKGVWSVVKGLTIDAFSHQKIQASLKELQDEKYSVYIILRFKF